MKHGITRVRGVEPNIKFLNLYLYVCLYEYMHKYDYDLYAIIMKRTGIMVQGNKNEYLNKQRMLTYNINVQSKRE